MDPITTILAALAAGAAAAVKDTAASAVKDGYEGLKAALRRKLANDSSAVQAVEQHAVSPVEAEAVLRPALEQAAVADDAAVVAAADTLLREADPSGAVRDRYALNVSGDVYGVVQGNSGNVTMNFGPPPTPRG